MAAMTAVPPMVDLQVLDDLRRRIRDTRRVDLLPDQDGRLGVGEASFAHLLASWSARYDWRPFEQRVQALPWTAVTEARQPLRVVHQRSETDGAPAVVLLHGWPDSVMRFEKVLPLLSDFHVVIPALPGYPFSLPARKRAMSAADIGDAVVESMALLGYDRYLVSAGDVGTDIAEAMAWSHPERVAALHLTDLSHHHALVDPPTDPSEEEDDYLRRVQEWHAQEGGYNHEQSTRPNTLAIGLGDSPAGLLAWIAEKLLRWSDSLAGAAFTSTDVLDWATAYWVSGTIGTSFAPYAHRSTVGRITVPATFTLFPGDIVSAPQGFAERFFDVRQWRMATGGGHFDAWERPADYAEGIRAAARA